MQQNIFGEMDDFEKRMIIRFSSHNRKPFILFSKSSTPPSNFSSINPFLQIIHGAKSLVRPFSSSNSVPQPAATTFAFASVWFIFRFRAGAADGAARGGWHLLRLLQDHARLEVRARLRVQSEVQGGQVHHRAGPHDQRERVGEGWTVSMRMRKRRRRRITGRNDENSSRNAVFI